MSVIDEISRFLSEGVCPTCADLGGADLLAAQADTLVEAPVLDVLVQMFALAHPAEKSTLQTLVLRGFAETGHALAFREAVDVLIECSEAATTIVGPLQKILCQRVENRASGPSLISAYAMECLFRLALADMIPRHRPLMLMVELEREDPPLFAANAARLAGAAFHVWREDSLLAALVRLLGNSDAESEAAMELGLASLSTALASDSGGDIAAQLQIARAYFDRAYKTGEERPDAAAYRATIDVLEGFASRQTSEQLSGPVEELETAVRQRDMWLFGLDLPEWLRPRRDREVQWVRLAQLVRATAGSLGRPSWLKPAAVMEQVLCVYDAERTVGAGPGLSRLLRPPIEAAFVQERGLRAHLDDLLASEDRIERREIAEKLRKRLTDLDGVLSPPGEGYEGVRFPLLQGALDSEQAVTEIPLDIAEKLELVLSDQIQARIKVAQPVIQRLLDEVSRLLQENEDYAGDVRANFDALTLQILMFCSSRLDANKSTLGERGAYRFDPNATEWDLQNDLYNFLIGNFPFGDLRAEVSDLAVGRADIYVTFGGPRFVLELKKEEDNATRDSLRQYLGQTTAYQVTNIRLGFLGVLDMTRSIGMAPHHLSESVWVEEHYVPGAALPRHVVVFRVAGNLPIPSSVQ
jgi:hypothetical protein